MDKIETNDLYENNKKCFKIQEKLLGSLYIVQNESNSMCVLWNKYQMFLYEDLNFEYATKVFVPEFQIRSLYICDNHLVCLDWTGNIHVITLKFKSSAQKRLRTSFQPKEQGILAAVVFSLETVLNLKIESNTYFLSLHQISTEFQVEKRILLTLDESPVTTATQDSCILKCFILSKKSFQAVRYKFNLTYDTGRDYSLILVTFDRITVYGCLFSPKMLDEEISLVKLYTNVSDICDLSVIEAENIYVIISLNIGTVIKLSLEDCAKPEVIHLNTALSKVLVTKLVDTIVYTDGSTLWKAENVFSTEIKFSQYFVKQTKDFIKVGNELICTTYSNLIYKFPTEDDSVFLKPAADGEYCAAETLLNNSDHFYKIIKEVEKGNELSKRLSKEGSYLTALALSQRQDIMDQVIQCNITIYNTYHDAIKENPEIILIEEVNKYFESNTVLFLIKLSSNVMHHTFNHILSNLFGDLKIHVKIYTDDNLVKTTSIKLCEMLKKVDLFSPVSVKNIATGAVFRVNVKIVTNIPGSLDDKKDIWTVLYRKKFLFASEYFVNIQTPRHSLCYKEPEFCIKEQIVKVAEMNHRNLFQFHKILEVNSNLSEWNFYVKLPQDFKDKLSSEKYKEYFNTQTANFFKSQLGSSDFLSSKSNLSFEVGDERVNIEIINYFSRSLIKVSSLSLKIALHIRNFLSNIIYDDYKSYGGRSEFINYSLYTTTENLQKSMKSSISNKDEKEIFDLVEQFQRIVFGAIPL